MTPKERMMLALERKKPDRLPVTIHQWQQYHLDTYLGGMDPLEAFKATGMDAAIQYFEAMGQFWIPDAEKHALQSPEWRDEITVVDPDRDHKIVHHRIVTPRGELTYKTGANRTTTWITEYLIKRHEDVDLIEQYMPVSRLDHRAIRREYDRIGEAGILRGFVWGDQAGCWQHAACLMDITDLIFAAVDRPDWVHRLLGILLEKKLQFVETMKGAKFDLIETGGGSASSTVISPTLHREFCLPYDRKVHDALHSLGFLVTYHTCGGTVGIEELIVANGCDASETLAPVSVGGNQEPWDFKRKVGDRIALIGGLDQFNTLTAGSAADIRAMVHRLFETVGCDGGYICSCSDHFFDTPVEKLVAFANAARECVYE